MKIINHLHLLIQIKINKNIVVLQTVVYLEHPVNLLLHHNHLIPK